jgi:hypothetical protein
MDLMISPFDARNLIEDYSTLESTRLSNNLTCLLITCVSYVGQYTNRQRMYMQTQSVLSRNTLGSRNEHDPGQSVLRHTRC